MWSLVKWEWRASIFAPRTPMRDAASDTWARSDELGIELEALESLHVGKRIYRDLPQLTTTTFGKLIACAVKRRSACS